MGEGEGMAEGYFVEATRDDGAGVWTSRSNVPGLVIETHTLDEFAACMSELVPDLLAANAGLSGQVVEVELIVGVKTAILALSSAERGEAVPVWRPVVRQVEGLRPAED